MQQIPNRTQVLLTFFTICTGLSSISQDKGIRFEPFTFQEVIQKAKEKNLYVFVDFYAEWCGPCKLLVKNVFPDSKVGRYFNNHFISLRIDAEKTEKDLVSKMHIDAYPTLVFFNSEGQVVKRIIGYTNKDDLLSAASACWKYKESALKAFQYKDKETFAQYLEMLNNSNPVSAMKMAKTYLDTLSLSELKDSINWSILTSFLPDFSHRSWKYIFNNATQFSQLFPDFSEKASRVSDSILSLAIKTRDTSILIIKSRYDYMLDTLSQVNLDINTLQMNNLFQYYKAISDFESSMLFLNKMLHGYFWNKWETLLFYAADILTSDNYSQNGLKESLSWAQQANTLSESWISHWIMAIGYHRLGMNEMEKDEMQKAMKLSLHDQNFSEEIDYLMVNLGKLNN
jgi:thioredoxin-related protein